jgi:hypothetical protein
VLAITVPEAQSCLLRFGGNACIDGAVTYVGAATMAPLDSQFSASVSAGGEAEIHETLPVAFLGHRSTTSDVQSSQKSRKRASESWV